MRRSIPASSTVPVDVTIVGGGVSGAALFRELGRSGYSVELLERGDFASGTSQASGLLAWGGLLYLRNLDLRTVRSLSRARDDWIAARPDEVRAAPFRYLPLQRGGRSTLSVRLALEAYWHLGSRRRSRPFRARAAREFLRQDRFACELGYEEATMTRSDARLVLEWILATRDDERRAFNHREVTGAELDASGTWTIESRDRLDGTMHTSHARVLVNAAGVWADGLAQRFGVRTRHRHVLSKGVYLVIDRPAGLDAFMAFEMENQGDTLTLTPWNDVALWGPTETIATSIDEGFEPTADDVRFLVEHANRNLARPLDHSGIVGLRVGVRPLAVKKAAAPRDRYPLDLSRRHAVDVDRAKHAITLYGGKFTSAPALARKAERAVAKLTEGSSECREELPYDSPPADFYFADRQGPLIDPGRARDREACRTLFDYLRRRTEIAWTIPRLGLGRGDAHHEQIAEIAKAIEGEERGARAVRELARAADGQDELVRRGLMGK